MRVCACWTPNRFWRFRNLCCRTAKYQPVADAVTLLLDRAPLTKDQQNAIHDLIAERDIEPLLKAANTDSEDGEMPVASLSAL